MIIVTNEKVSGFVPRWAPFQGFSALFDNPGDSLTPLNGSMQTINCPVLTEPDLQDGLALYRALNTGLQKINPGLLVNTYLFCPLPPFSYHVTVWDGLNARNAGAVHNNFRTELENYLAMFPESFFHKSTFTKDAEDSPLIKTKNFAITFKFSKLIKWDNDGLTALLEPADEKSVSTLGLIRSERKKLYDTFESRFETTLFSPYYPHVSLGYFANCEQAQLTTPLITEWEKIIRDTVRDLTIHFESISLYGFTDMTTFFKRPQT